MGIKTHPIFWPVQHDAGLKGQRGNSCYPSLLGSSYKFNPCYTVYLDMSSSIYTCAQVSGSTAPAAFQEVGLKSETSCRIEESGVHILPNGNIDLGFSVGTANIHDWCYAYEKDVLVPSGTPFRKVLQDFGTPDVTPPLCAVIYAAETEEEKSMMASAGMVVGPGSRKNLWLGSPTLQYLRILAKHGVPLVNPGPAGNPPLGGLFAFYYGWKAVTLACLFSRGKKDLSSFRLLEDGEIEQTYEAEKGMQRPGSAEEEILKIVGGEMVTDSMGIFEIQSAKYLSVPHHRSNIDNSEAFEELDTVFKEQGTVFPYFDSLLEPSREFASGVFFRYFSRCLGDSAVEVGAIAPILRLGFRNLSASSAGRALTHALFGVQAMFESGASLRILQQGSVYKGFVLQGNFITMNRGLIVEPVTGAVLTKAVRDINRHAAAVEAIARMLTVQSLKDGGGNEVVTPSDINTSRKMANQFFRRMVENAEFREMAKVEVSKLAFGDTYLEITRENVERALRAFRTHDGNMDAPFHPTLDNLVSSNPIRRVLASFGGNCPTIQHGTMVLNISRPTKDCPLLVAKPDGRRALPYIPIYAASIGQAVKDWMSVQARHVMKFDAPKKGNLKSFAGRGNDVFIVSGDEMIPFYSLIREFSYMGDDVPDVAGKGKRKATDDGEDAEGKEKRVKNRKAAIDFL